MHDEAFERMLEDLTAKAAVPIYEFPSATPLIRLLIRGYRKLRNGVFTRWYGQHYVNGQTLFNVAVVDALRHQHYDIERKIELLNQRILKQAAQLDSIMMLCRQLKDNVERSEEQRQEQMRMSLKMLDSDLEAIVRQMNARKP